MSKLTKKDFERQELTKKEEDRLRKEYFEDVTKLNSQIKKEFRKKLIIIISITVIVILVIKIFLGTIEIYNPFGYPASKARFYKVRINDELVTVDYDLNQRISIIPFLINFNNHYFGSSYIETDEDGTEYHPSNSNEYIIEIKSYTCYSLDYQVECMKDSQEMKENNDTKYTNLKITRTNKPYEVVYDGKYINDITKYVKEKGIYAVTITAEYSNIDTDVTFYFARR